MKKYLTLGLICLLFQISCTQAPDSDRTTAKRSDVKEAGSQEISPPVAGVNVAPVVYTINASESHELVTDRGSKNHRSQRRLCG